jgi:uncharacterized membrane protein
MKKGLRYYIGALGLAVLLGVILPALVSARSYEAVALGVLIILSIPPFLYHLWRKK